jgi:hypothetical protein
MELIHRRYLEHHPVGGGPPPPGSPGQETYLSSQQAHLFQHSSVWHAGGNRQARGSP